MKKIFYAMATITAALVLSLGSSAAATAATTPAPSSPVGVTAAPADVEAQQSCRARFSANVSHRASPNSSSTRYGIVPAGRWVPASCSITTGGSYTACGSTSNYWLRVYWNGSWGYSVYTCVTNWEYV